MGLENPNTYWFPLDKWEYETRNGILFVKKTWEFYKETNPDWNNSPKLYATLQEAQEALEEAEDDGGG